MTEDQVGANIFDVKIVSSELGILLIHHGLWSFNSSRCIKEITSIEDKTKNNHACGVGDHSADLKMNCNIIQIENFSGYSVPLFYHSADQKLYVGRRDVGAVGIDVYNVNKDGLETPSTAGSSAGVYRPKRENTGKRYSTSLPPSAFAGLP